MLVFPNFVLLMSAAKLVLSYTNEVDYDERNSYIDYPANDNGSKDFHMLVSGGYRPKIEELYSMYVVSIRTTMPTQYFGDNHFCSGAIISTVLILTAAHCVMDSRRIITRSHRLRVVAGTPNRLKKVKNTVECRVQKVIPHPHFYHRSTNDLALLLLKESDELPQHRDSIKVMPIVKSTPKIGTKCTTLGWGQIFMNGPYSASPVYADLEILEHSICEKSYDNYQKEGMLCAGAPNDTELDICHGDLGGPLICANRLAGIVAWGRRCGAFLPVVFTDVHFHREWINSINHSEFALKVSVIKGSEMLRVLLGIIFIEMAI